MNKQEIIEAYRDANVAEIYIDVILTALPFVGVMGFIFGLIDLDYGFSRKQGVRRVSSFLVSHTVYLAAIILGTVL